MVKFVDHFVEFDGAVVMIKLPEDSPSHVPRESPDYNYTCGLEY